MKNLSLTLNASHPIHHALAELFGYATQWLASARPRDMETMLGATAKAMGAVKIASTGSRRSFHLELAFQKLLWVQNGFQVLFQRGKLSAEVFDESRRRLDQVLACVERLAAIDQDDWSTIELPPIATRPVDIAEDATIKLLRHMLTRIIEETRALRLREQPSAPGPNDPLKQAA